MDGDETTEGMEEEETKAAKKLARKALEMNKAGTKAADASPKVPTKSKASTKAAAASPKVPTNKKTGAKAAAASPKVPKTSKAGTKAAAASHKVPTRKRIIGKADLTVLKLPVRKVNRFTKGATYLMQNTKEAPFIVGCSKKKHAKYKLFIDIIKHEIDKGEIDTKVKAKSALKKLIEQADTVGESFTP